VKPISYFLKYCDRFLACLQCGEYLLEYRY